MGKFFLLTAFIVLSYLSLHAQKIYKFKLSPIPTKVSNSLYNSLVVLDYRGDTTSMGFVHTGLMNYYSRVVPAIPVSSQFKNLFNSIIDSTAANGKLLLQITRLIFAERENSFTEDGYFNMRANLYSKIGGHYQRVGSIDTLFYKSSIDPTKEILKAGNEIMAGFIIENLKVQPSGSILDYYDIVNFSDIEKNEIPLYNKYNDYIDGLYLNYKSFKNQMPDRQIIVDNDDLNSSNIRTIEGDGITQEVTAHNVYAIVYKGHPYVVSEGVYYPLKKVGNDFFFVGKARDSFTLGDELVSDIAGGAAIGIFAKFTATFEMKIDYKNGAFIRMKKILDFKGNPVEQKKK